MSDTARPAQSVLFTHRNHYLFSDYYLDRRTAGRAEWRAADAGPALAAMTALWRKYKPQADNEAQTEADWIRPVLAALGHHFNVQVGVQTPLGAKVADYAFYPDEAARQAAKRGVLAEADFAGALAIGDAKAWERSLDRAAAREVRTLHENPSLQIDTYIRHSGLAWGILTNGRLWRLYHKDSSKKLDIYYEVDLPALIEQGDAEAFKYFWLFFRREAFMAAAHAPAAPAWLDLVLAESLAYAQGVGEDLKAQVYDALRCLGQGFLDFGRNDLQPTAETLAEIQDNSLIVLYRLLFMFYAEARDLLPVRENRTYARGYSLDFLKHRVAEEMDDGKPAAASMSGLWQRLYELWHVIDAGDATLGVPAYNGGLFRPHRYPFLERCRVGDLYLRQAIDLLARAADPTTGRREFVDYRDLEIRHLGSIYEGLLEYRLRCGEAPTPGPSPVATGGPPPRPSPVATGEGVIEAGQVYLVTDKGDRKATGSYYTPEYIVQYIVEHTLGPVLEERTARFRDADGGVTDPVGLERAILGMNCLDPAMGSGHFLVAATEYIARYAVGLGLATDEKPITGHPPSATGHPSSAISHSPSAIRHSPSAIGRPPPAEPDLAYWRRRVAQACIYGVDLNPLAVELAKLSLWLATVSKDKPLSFLDHHLRCGNSLIGARVADLPLGAAPAEPAARERRAAYKARQAAQKRAEAAREAGQLTMLDDSAFAGAMHTASGMMRLIEDLGSETLADVRRAEEVYRDSVRAVTEKARLLGDVWTARHFGLALDDAVWGGLSRYLLHGGFEMPAYRPILEQACAIASARRFFHWELEFPEVFFDEHGRLVEGGGFDVVMGNPPYVRSIRLRDTDLASWAYYASHFQAARVGEYDLYLCFAEGGLRLLGERGRFGMIMPNKWFTTQVGAGLRGWLVQRKALGHVVDFGHFQIFPGVTTYICLLFLRAAVCESISIALLDDAGGSSAPLPGRSGQWQQVTSSPTDLGVAAWSFAAAGPGALLHKLALLPRLQNVADIFCGAGTRADEVFQMERQAQTFYSRSLKTWVELEPDLMQPSLTGRNIDRYTCTYANYLLFPYLLEQRGVLLIPSAEMASAYPKIWAYLNHPTNRSILQRRDRGVFQNRDDWYGYGRPQNMHLLGLPKVVLPDVAGRGEFTCDAEGRYIIDTVYAIRAKEGVPVSLLAMTALLNSPVLTFFLRQTGTGLRGGYFRMKTAYLNPFPLPDFSFTTPAAARAALAAEAKQLAEAAVATGDLAAILAFVAAQLAAQPERSDVVHDLLAALAEQMIALNKQRGDEVRGFLAWLERETGARVEDLTGKSQLKNYLGDYQKGEAPLPYTGLLDILKKNRRKLAVDPAGRKFQEALKKEYEASLAALGPLKARLAATDRLIDRVVYRLYGLTEEEVRLVESTGM